jgi:hypothetical protein
MNIFVLDIDPTKAAQYLCDTHLIRMTQETTELLCTVHRLMDKNDQGKHPNPTLEELLLPASDVDHPCVLWAMESIHNYHWIYAHGVALLMEYSYRFKKDHIHHELYGALYEIPHGFFFIDDTFERTPFVQCVPEKYKVLGDKNYAISAYRLFYIGEVIPTATWTLRTPPYWYVNGIDKTCFDGWAGSAPREIEDKLS